MLIESHISDESTFHGIEKNPAVVSHASSSPTEVAPRPVTAPESQTAMSLNIHSKPGSIRPFSAVGSLVMLAVAAASCTTSPVSVPAEAKLVNADQLRPASRIRTQLNTRDFQKSFAGGTTTLRVSIGADGKVDDVRIAESSGNASVDSAAARSLVGAAFVPYRENGVAIPVITLMPMRFTPSGCIMAKPLDC